MHYNKKMSMYLECMCPDFTPRAWNLLFQLFGDELYIWRLNIDYKILSIFHTYNYKFINHP